MFKEVKMTTVTFEERLEEIRRQIDHLQARARTGSAEARTRIQPHLDAVRQEEASVRAAVRTADGTAKEKLALLEARLEVAEQALIADVADGKTKFTAAVNAELHSWDPFFERLQSTAATKTGKAREQAEASVADLRSRRASVAELVAQMRSASESSWHAQKTRVTAAREDLEQKADQLAAKLR
jgi:hypothetical protein